MNDSKLEAALHGATDEQREALIAAAARAEQGLANLRAATDEAHDALAEIALRSRGTGQEARA